MQKKVKRFVLKTGCFCILISAFGVTPARAFNSHAPFDISADMIDYVDADQTMTAEGHAVVIQGTSTLKADHLRYDRADQRLYAQGHVLLDDNGSVLLGDTLNYDLRSESGTVTSALGFQSPWIYSGAAWQKEMDYYIGHQMSFTSCDLADPHYHLRSSSVHLVPDVHFWAWNNIGYLDTLPVFYSPFMYKNLAKQRLTIQFQPGHDDINGDFLKTLTTLSFTNLIYDKVLFDHYSFVGNGLGNEFDYQVPGKMLGSMFGYYINPHGDSQLAGSPQGPQYNFRSYHWEQLDKTTILQSNVNLRQNVSFNNQYFSEDTNQNVNDITSSVALTKQTTHVNQQLVVQQDAAPDSGDTSEFAATHVQTAQLPSYNVTLLQVPLWKPKSVAVSSMTSSNYPMMGPWTSSAAYASQGLSTAMMGPFTSSAAYAAQAMALNPPRALMAPPSRLGPVLLSANGSLGQTYQRLDGQTHPAGNGSVTLTESMPLSRRWSFTPSVTPSLNWQDKFVAQAPPVAGSTTPVSTAGLFRGYQGRLGTSEGLRWRPFSLFTLDQTYALTGRLAPNGTDLDRAQPDGGLETNHLSWQATWNPSRRVYMRSLSGFDMRRIADEDPNVYNQRKWDPWLTELTLTPTKRTNYFFRYEVGYYPLRDILWEADWNHNGPYKTLIQEGLLYNNASSGLMTWNNALGIYLSPGWRVDATVHLLVPSGNVDQAIRSGNLIDENFIVTRDMHCWRAKFIYQNVSAFSRSYSIVFDLKLGDSAKDKITNNDLESTFYPWRSRATAM